MKRFCIFVLLILAALIPHFAQGAPLPDAHTGGKAGGPMAILILSPGPQIDAQYAKELSAAGFTYVLHTYTEPLTEAFIRKFSVIVIDKFPWFGAQYQLFGQRLAGFDQNMEMVWRFAQGGGGVLVYCNIGDGGGPLARGWNAQMKRWDIRLFQGCLRDHATAFSPFRVYGECCYCSTDAITPHPVTEGVKHFYYPSVNARFDDCYTATPLLPGKEWTSLVKGNASSEVFIEVDGKEIDLPEHKADTTLVAVRDVGKGRMSVFSINPAYTHQLGYTLNGRNSELNFGPIDGLILAKGDKGVASDTGKLLMNLYRWLGEPAAAAGFGGYKQGDAVEKAVVAPVADQVNYQPRYDPEHVPMPLSWRSRAEVVTINKVGYVMDTADPLITGELRYLKALVGVHSAASDGKGSVADYVAAAKKAGYSLILFSENYAELTPEKWASVLAQCEKETTADFFCMPGIDIQDPAGNHFILAGVEDFPRKQWMTADGKRLLYAQCINWMLGGHTVIAHRPLGGPLPYERLKHFQALTVFTYRGGKLVEDATPAYDWQQQAGSSPHPVVVHEVFSPEEVAVAAKTGYQQIMPSDTPAHAAGYFQAGMGSYYDGPSRHILSEGPVVYDYTVNARDVGPAEMNREQYRVSIGVKSDSPQTMLKVVELHDGPTVVRRWLPTGSDFTAQVDFHHSFQRALYLTVEDAKGHKALTASIRNVAHRYVTRCADRQNWLGDAGFCYTGTFLPPAMGASEIMMPIKGTLEGTSLMPDKPGMNMAPKLSFPFVSNQLVLTTAELNEKYTQALFDTAPLKIGFDGTSSQASEPSTVYDAKVRYYNFTPGNGAPLTVSLMNFAITLKRDVEPVNPAGLFPALGQHGGKSYWFFKEGKGDTGLIVTDKPLDVPVGGMVGSVIALTPGLRAEKGLFGFAPVAGNPTSLKKGTCYDAWFLRRTGLNWQNSAPQDFETDTAGWMQAMGFAGETPYRLALTRGKLSGVTYFATMAAQDHGVAGSVATPAKIPFHVPLRVGKVNPRWPAGIWREGAGVVFAGVYEEETWPLLDVARPGVFYAGNLVVSDNEALVMEIVEWSAAGIKVEVHNPTDSPISAVVRTPGEITGLMGLKESVKVGAGSSIFVTKKK